MLHVMPYGAWNTRASLPWLRTPSVPPSLNGLWPNTEASPAPAATDKVPTQPSSIQNEGSPS